MNSLDVRYRWERGNSTIDLTASVTCDDGEFEVDWATVRAYRRNGRLVTLSPHREAWVVSAFMQEETIKGSPLECFRWACEEQAYASID